MIFQRLTKRALWLVTVCLPLFGGGTSGDLVLCFGADGRVAFAPAGQPHCNHPAHPEESSLPQLQQQEAPRLQGLHRCACVDIPVSGSPAASQLLTKADRPSPDVSACFPEAPPVFGGHAASAAASESFLQTSPYFVPLSTIVLLV
jgi:hypothetical protein